MNDTPQICQAHNEPLIHTFTYQGVETKFCDRCMRSWATVEAAKPGWLLDHIGQEGLDKFLEIIKTIPPPPFVCPWCDTEIHGIEWRPFGPGGILNLAGCKICLKPFGVLIVQFEDPGTGAGQPPKKSGIITPGRP